ncbi:MAG: glycosyltransferase [Acidobacteria bacterium]|nr:MAG: glycosyltransferase [Acidobacteriota bacterium]
MATADLPLVTIVTPSYNQGRFIEETVQSVFSQDYPNLEYLVFDGGSRDGTVDILRKYSDRLWFVSERDRGQSHAINKGFRKAKGEIVAFLNSDDTYLPGAVCAAVRALQENPQAPMVYGEGNHVREDGTVMDRYPTEPFSYSRLRETCFICQPTTFMRSSAVRAIGYVNESLHYCMDYDLWIRLSKLGAPVYVNQLLATSRLYSENKTLGQRRQMHWEIARNWKDHLGEVPTAWVFALAHAILETRWKFDRTKPRDNALFVSSLTALSALLFLYFNQEIKPEESRQLREWAGWLVNGVAKKLRMG